MKFWDPAMLSLSLVLAMCPALTLPVEAELDEPKLIPATSCRAFTYDVYIFSDFLEPGFPVVTVLNSQPKIVTGYKIQFTSF